MQPVSLRLDQNGVRHISRTLLLTKERPFQQPYSDMNIACGFPKFVPLSSLENYIKNDTISSYLLMLYMHDVVLQPDCITVVYNRICITSIMNMNVKNEFCNDVLFYVPV